MDFVTSYILLVIFIATLIRSTFGFGESLVAVPLLLFVIPIEVAVPLSVLLSICIAAVVVVQDRKQVHFQSAKYLLLFAILGIPLGLLMLIYGSESLIKAGLGILIVLFSIFSLIGKSTLTIKGGHRGWLFFCGFLSGILGGAYGLNGPPLIVYGRMRKWTAKHFRATLQAYFLPASTIGMFGYWYKGLWSPQVTHYFLISLPVFIPAIFLGRFLNHRLKEDSFVKFVYLGLLCVGFLLFAQGIRSLLKPVFLS